MAVVNLTPDSFSDRGSPVDSARAIDTALQMIDQGADIIDLGAESTRPGARPVEAAVEIARLMPVLQALAAGPVPVSIDTRKPEVMRVCLDAGADMINDVAGFVTDGAIEAVSDRSCALCVMHMQGDPTTMQNAPAYRDVVADVTGFLRERVVALQAAGVSRERIVVDPGIGFGKTLAHNLELLAGLDVLAALDIPILVGVSRKSMIGALTGRPLDDRLAGSLAAALAAVSRGATIVRVHDVGPTRDALRVWHAIEETARRMAVSKEAD
jgi:dihydropteroate synthase